MLIKHLSQKNFDVYFLDTDGRTCHHRFLQERKALFMRVTDQDISEKAWIDLVVKLSLTDQLEKASQKYPDNQRMQRLFVLDQYVSCLLNVWF